MPVEATASGTSLALAELHLEADGVSAELKVRVRV